MKIDRRLLAYHEAGHAVASCLERMPITSVSIESDANSQGRCLRRGWPARVQPDLHVRPRTTRYVQAQIVVLLGGHAGEQLGARRSLTSKQAGASVDWQHAFELAVRITGSMRETNAYMEWLWIYTQDLLKHPPNRRALRAVADALQSDLTISGRSARALTDDAIKGWMLRGSNTVEIIRLAKNEVDADETIDP